MLRTVSCRLQPTRRQAKEMRRTLESCRQLYNAVSERYRSQIQRTGSKPALSEAMAYLDDLRTQLDLYGIYAQVLQNVILRVDAAYAGYINRREAGLPAGMPRFKAVGRYLNYTYPQHGYSCGKEGLEVSRLGRLKIRGPLPKSTAQRLTIRLNATGKWYADFTVEVGMRYRPPAARVVALVPDPPAFVASSEGSAIAIPRSFARDLGDRRRVSNHLHAADPVERARRQRALAHINERIRRRRSGFTHQLSADLVSRFQTICYPRLSSARSQERNRFVSALHQEAWNTLTTYLTYKAAEAGREIVRVNPRYLDQRCSRCQGLSWIDLEAAQYTCAVCGFQETAATNRALNILALGLQRLGKIPRSRFTRVVSAE